MDKSQHNFTCYEREAQGKLRGVAPTGELSGVGGSTVQRAIYLERVAYIARKLCGT